MYVHVCVCTVYLIDGACFRTCTVVMWCVCVFRYVVETSRFVWRATTLQSQGSLLEGEEEHV